MFNFLDCMLRQPLHVFARCAPQHLMYFLFSLLLHDMILGTSVFTAVWIWSRDLFSLVSVCLQRVQCVCVCGVCGWWVGGCVALAGLTADRWALIYRRCQKDVLMVPTITPGQYYTSPSLDSSLEAGSTTMSHTDELQRLNAAKYWTLKPYFYYFPLDNNFISAYYRCFSVRLSHCYCVTSTVEMFLHDLETSWKYSFIVAQIYILPCSLSHWSPRWQWK